MAANPPPPFSNDEKNFLLAEICKSASPHYTILLEVCNRLNTQPSWNDLPLPPGRSVNACRAALDEMRRGPISYSPLSATSGIPQAPIAIAPQPRIQETQYAAGRKILPRQAPHGFFRPISADQQPLKRKRGRPTKAEVQARAEAASSSSAVDPGTPEARLQTPMSVSVPPSPGIDVRSSTILPSVSRALPISAMITPAAPKSASHSGSSSGKRRRRRRSEEGQDDPMVSQTQAYYSPTRQSSTLDSAQRAAFMTRRRDDSIHTGVARLGVSEPEQTAGAQSSPAQAGNLSRQPSPGRPPYQ